MVRCTVPRGCARTGGASACATFVVSSSTVAASGTGGGGVDRRRRRMRPATRPNGAARHPDSESDTEELGTCRADQVGWVNRGAHTTTLLCRGCCPDAAASPLTPMLGIDAANTDLTGFVNEDGGYLMPLCRVHSNQYLVARQRDRCVVDGCNRAWTHDANGVRLCAAHLSDPDPRPTTPVPGGPVPLSACYAEPWALVLGSRA